MNANRYGKRPSPPLRYESHSGYHEFALKLALFGFRNLARPEDAVAGYEAGLRRIVLENSLEVTPEKWDAMDSEQRKRFYGLKMKEAKTLGDREAFDFWAANREKDA